MTTTTIAPGVILTPGYLDRAAQDELLAAVRAVIQAAPLFVMMTNCGALGWVTDAARA
jgi:alkylated DNA repair protein (DNA oxidative demethylase)